MRRTCTRTARRRLWRARRTASGPLRIERTARSFRTRPALRPLPRDRPACPRSRSMRCSRVQTFQTVDLGALRMARPRNWELVDSQQSSATIAPRAGVSAGSVAYGVVIRSARAPAANMEAGQLTAAIVQSLQNGDSNMKQVGEIQGLGVGRDLRRVGGIGNDLANGWAGRKAAARAGLAGCGSARSEHDLFCFCVAAGGLR